ncbi:28S rRNA (cytosine-C(5))-methyltransferase-like [Saccostrea echinata]|uniref:28S rRNA (cytosine-C(5))-methyltransferase-like n=1 Tax=Saccostrea echinata TaxID=191078 RepID=UPI002A840FC9|nr:28S rRNA (cytosine-C(5))-methyltransferase-like [Saccostrea echinata]
MLATMVEDKKKNSNLYIEAAKVLHEIYDKKGSIKTSVYGSSFQDKQMLSALVNQTLRYAKILETVVKRTKLLEKNKLLWNDEMLARVLLYDFMIGPGLFRPGRLKVVVAKNRECITSEFDRLLTVYGVQHYADLPYSTSEALPRYVRVNLIKVTMEEVIKVFMDDGWTLVPMPDEVDSFIEACRNLGEAEFMKDFHLSDLLVFPAYTDLHNHHLVQKSKVILQDKASCLPAHILSPPEGAVVVDSCAAPGNKTSHLASLMGNNGTIYAFEHKAERIAIFQDRMEAAGVTCKVARCMDFLRVKTDSQAYKDVKYIMVDPSCSGSGIVNRLDDLTNDDSSTTQHRLDQLHKLQAKILRHAFSFPNVKKIVYSTCSVHEEENEQVCEEIYNRFKERFKIQKVMKDWPERGREGYQKSDHYLRACPDRTLTNGFFVAHFKRRKNKEKKTSEDSGMENENVEEGYYNKEKFSDNDNELDMDRKKKKKRKKEKKEVLEEERSEREKMKEDGKVRMEDGDVVKVRKSRKKKIKGKGELTNDNENDKVKNIHKEESQREHLLAMEASDKVRKSKRKIKETDNEIRNEDCEEDKVKKSKKKKRKADDGLTVENCENDKVKKSKKEKSNGEDVPTMEDKVKKKKKEEKKRRGRTLTLEECEDDKVKTKEDREPAHLGKTQH